MDSDGPMSERWRRWGPRLLVGLGAVGGLLWAIVPVLAAVAFYGIETGGLGVGTLGGLGVLFQFFGVAVVFMLLGVVGIHLSLGDRYGRSGTVGAGVSILGFLLLLPGSVVPSGSLPASVAGVVPLLFFAGLLAIAVGSALLGIDTRRTGALPATLAVSYGAAMPVGFVVGGSAAVTGAGNLPLVLGLMVPYGFAWTAVGASIATADG